MKNQKPAVWMGSSKDDLREFPVDVGRVMGVAINDAQNGEEHPAVKALKGFGGRSTLEMVDEFDGEILSRRLHRPLRWRDLHPSLLPEEVEKGQRDAQARNRARDSAIEGR